MSVDRWLAVAEGAITAGGALIPDDRDTLQTAQRLALRSLRALRQIMRARTAEKALELLEAIAGPQATKPISDAELDAQVRKVVDSLTRPS